MFNQSGKSRHIGDDFEGAFAAKVRQELKRRRINVTQDKDQFESLCLKQQKLNSLDHSIIAKMERAAINAAEFAIDQHQSFFKPRGDFKLRLNDDATDIFDVRDCTIVNPNGQELGFSLKWRNDEIKSPRLQSDWMRKFHLPNDGVYEQITQPIVEQLARFETWKQAKEELGDEAVHVPFRDGLLHGLNQIMKDSDAQRHFCLFLFGSVSHIKVTVQQNMRKVHFADYNPANLPDEIKYVEADRHSNKWVWLAFNKGWQLKFRLHSRETRIKPNVRSGMGLGVTVQGWGHKNPVQVVLIPNGNPIGTLPANTSGLPSVS